jgi:hypothetical protein
MFYPIIFNKVWSSSCAVFFIFLLLCVLQFKHCPQQFVLTVERETKFSVRMKQDVQLQSKHFLVVVSSCCSWYTAWNRYGHNFICFVALWAIVIDKHFPCPEIFWSVVLVCYSVGYVLVRTRIAKCFANSSKRFRCVLNGTKRTYYNFVLTAGHERTLIKLLPLLLLLVQHHLLGPRVSVFYGIYVLAK